MESSALVFSEFVQSITSNFEKFLVDIDQKNIVISDKLVIESFRNMSRTLQRILSKKTMCKPEEHVDKNSPKKLELEFLNSTKKPELDTSKSSSGLFDDSFLYDNDETRNKVRSRTTDGTSTGTLRSELLNSDSPKKEMFHNASTDIMRKRMKKDIEDSSDEDSKKSSVQHLPRKAESDIFTNPALEKIGESIYKCLPCGKELNKNNVLSHLNGRNHKNKSRDNSSSSDRISSSTNASEFEIDAFDDNGRDLKLNKNGEPYIITRITELGEFFHCNLCNVDISKYKVNLVQHLKGQQHKRLFAQQS